VGAAAEAVGVEVRLAAQLHDAFGQLVGVLGFLAGVLQELLGGHVGLHALGHVVMAFVAQHTHQLRGQRVVEQAQHLLAVGVIAFGHGALVNILASGFTQGVLVGQCNGHDILQAIRLGPSGSSAPVIG